MKKEISNDAELISRLVSMQPTPAECLVAAARIEQLAARVAELEGALSEHHNWHLSQDRDANAWGIDPVDAYSGSGLCERTVAALRAKAKEVDHG